MNANKTSTRIAGIDVSKRWLDVAVHGGDATLRVANAPEGLADLVSWLAGQDVGRVGLEATGGYERAPVAALAKAGFEVTLHQPLEVRLFARIRRIRAKNDRIDAKLIACATAQIDSVKAAADPRLAELAERLTAYEQAADLVAQIKTGLEHVTLSDLRDTILAQLRTLTQHKKTLAADLVRRIRTSPDLARRFDLLRSLPGVGPIVALGLTIRMPELGAMERGQASSLIGVAPFDRESGTRKGQRVIGAGRERPRRLLYLAAMAAKRCDTALKAFAKRLADKGKPPKVIVVAVMRKLIEAANLVITRNEPWAKTAPKPQP